MDRLLFLAVGIGLGYALCRGAYKRKMLEDALVSKGAKTA